MSGTGDPEWRISALRGALATGRLDPFDVVDEVRRRLADQEQPQAWLWTASPEELRSRALDLVLMPSEVRPPLWGIPFAVKDNIDVAGIPTTVGCPDFTYVPQQTATSVQRLLDAGAILVGKTNLDQFATGLTGARSPFGACVSVVDPRLPSGGSSSGSAVVVASGIVPFALGTDTAGSGRVPAALNAIVGLKPTRGLVSTAGVFPACRSLDCVSVFAQDVADAWDVLSVLTGPDVGDPWSRPQPLAEGGEPRSLRIGVVSAESSDWPGETGQRVAYISACERLAPLVGSIELVDIGPFLEAGDLLYEGPWIAERYATLGSFLEEHPDSVHPSTAAVLRRGREITGAQVFSGIHRLRTLGSQVDRVWAEVDALMLPTIDTTPSQVEVAADDLGTTRALGRWTHFANLLDLAVLAVPNELTPSGRPASVSFVGPAFSDMTLAKLAHEFTSAGPATAPVSWSSAAGPTDAPWVRLAVVGHHLSGGPRNHELVEREARLIATTRTAPHYRLYRISRTDGTHIPGLLRVSSGGLAQEVELWELPASHVGSLLAGVRSPLGFGQVELEDGSWTIGFLCEAHATAGASDISEYGGWRAFRSAVSAQPV